MGSRPIPVPDFEDQMSGLALGEAVFSVDRSQLVPTTGYYRAAGMGDWADDYAQMAGVKSFFKSLGTAVGGAAKSVGKGAVNAAAAKVGLGPIFPAGQTAAVVPYGQQEPARTNYTPFLIAGAAGLGLLTVVLLTRKK